MSELIFNDNPENIGYFTPLGQFLYIDNFFYVGNDFLGRISNVGIRCNIVSKAYFLTGIIGLYLDMTKAKRTGIN